MIEGYRQISREREREEKRGKKEEERARFQSKLRREVIQHIVNQLTHSTCGP